MRCELCKEYLEQYINGELDTENHHSVEQHLDSCTSCRNEYHELRSLIGNLRVLKDSIGIKDSYSPVNNPDIFKKPGPMAWRTKIAVIVAGISVCISLVAGSFLAFPALAEQYAPSLPIVRSMHDLKQEVVKLETEIKKIQGTNIKVIQTQPALPEEENRQIQELAMKFVKAQYDGDISALQELSTPAFAKIIQQDKDQILKTRSGAVAFGSITNVAKEGDIYVVFVRISDSEFVDSEYQENFNIKKSDGKFLIDFMGMDA